MGKRIYDIKYINMTIKNTSKNDYFRFFPEKKTILLK